MNLIKWSIIYYISSIITRLNYNAPSNIRLLKSLNEVTLMHLLFSILSPTLTEYYCLVAGYDRKAGLKGETSNELTAGGGLESTLNLNMPLNLRISIKLIERACLIEKTWYLPPSDRLVCLQSKYDHIILFHLYNIYILYTLFQLPMGFLYRLYSCR